MASTYLSWTPSNTETSPYKRTISVWCKRANVSNEMVIISARPTQRQFFRFETTGELRTLESGGLNWSFITNAKYRDTNGWYHIVFAYDSTQATSTDRMKLYVNGEQVTSFSAITYPPLNETIDIGRSGYPIHIGNDSEQTNPYFDGLMSHFHLIDGTAYQASDFGEYDANGVWTPKTSPSVTYGTNGFFLKMENSGSMGTDSSGNGNNFTVNGTLTQTVDTPSNVYATFNPLIPQGLAYANGNLSATHNAASWKTAYGTFAMSGTGKYYFESKVSTLGSYQGVGIVDVEQATSTAGKFVAQSRGYGYKTTGEKTNNDIDTSYGGTYTTGDIIMTAVDLNAGAIWFGKNGTWLNSATQSEIEAGTTTNAAFTSISNSYVYYPAIQIYGSGTNQVNFGNGYFGTTAVASAGSNGNGSIFEYDVPSGYYALNTKNLATYG